MNSDTLWLCIFYLWKLIIKLRIWVLAHEGRKKSNINFSKWKSLSLCYPKGGGKWGKCAQTERQTVRQTDGWFSSWVLNETNLRKTRNSLMLLPKLKRLWLWMWLLRLRLLLLLDAAPSSAVIRRRAIKFSSREIVYDTMEHNVT